MKNKTIANRLKEIVDQIPTEVCLVAVSKTKPKSSILEAYTHGQRVFGENKVQDLVDKAADLPDDIEWHMIGHLQSNKVKYIAPFVALIHAVDSMKLLNEINKRAIQNNRVIDVLLQIHIAKEESKYGLKAQEVNEILDASQKMAHVKVVGLMGMATNTLQTEIQKIEFKELKNLYDILNNQGHNLSILSMGMSGDYNVAIEQGSTMVRLGSSIFGKRN